MIPETLVASGHGWLQTDKQTYIEGQLCAYGYVQKVAHDIVRLKMADGRLGFVIARQVERARPAAGAGEMWVDATGYAQMGDGLLVYCPDLGMLQDGSNVFGGRVESVAYTGAKLIDLAGRKTDIRFRWVKEEPAEVVRSQTEGRDNSIPVVSGSVTAGTRFGQRDVAQRSGGS